MADVNRKHLVVPLNERLKIISTGIDWITATSTTPTKCLFMRTVANVWQEERKKQGYRERPYAGNGYTGTYVDGITYGERDDGAMLRLSGEVAKEHAYKVPVWSDRISRIDFQATLQDDNYENDWASRTAYRAMEDKRVVAGQTKWSRLQGSDGGTTFYLGRRISQRFYRVYDKTAESKGLYPQRTWRWEVEYKGPRAETWGMRIKSLNWTADDSMKAVKGAFSDYGFQLPCLGAVFPYTDTSPREPSNDERKIDYLKKCIKPMMLRLLEAYDRSMLLECIGMDEQPTLDVMPVE